MASNYEREEFTLFDDDMGNFSFLSELKSFIPSGESAFSIEALSQKSERVPVSMEFISDSIFRMRYTCEKALARKSTAMLVAEPLSSGKVKTEESTHDLLFKGDSLTVAFKKKPWIMKVLDSSGKTLMKSSHADEFGIPNRYRVLPPGFRKGPEGGVHVFHSGYLFSDEHFYGLGEKFSSLDRRHQKFISWHVDAHGTNSNEWAYKNIPFFFSSRGYGIFINSSFRIVYDFGERSYVSWFFSLEDSLMDFFFIYGPSPRDIIARYTDLTGRSEVPPRWSFGLWMSRCMYKDRGEVEEVAAGLRSSDIPCDVLHIDPLWLKGRKERDRDSACELSWDEEAFPDPGGMIEGLKKQGFRLSLWENPYIHEGSALYQEGKEKGFFPLDSQGNPARLAEDPCCTLVDFSNPEACRWFAAKHESLFRTGVAVMKTDYGEYAPVDARYHNGMTGSEMHNLYPLLYNKTIYEATKKYRGYGLVWGRSAYAGSQRYPLYWSGDSRPGFNEMACVLRGGLSMALSGFPFWSHDIGGFIGKPHEILYIRWAQWGLLSSHARCHGTTPREPWHFGERALEIFRTYAKLRYRLIPYLYSYAHVASLTGMPLMRPLLLEFPGDRRAWEEDLEYLLGRELLVAPVCEAEEGRALYFPEGKWLDFWTGKIYSGPSDVWYDAPLDILPLFIRANSIIPMSPGMPSVGEEPEKQLTCEVYLTDRAEFLFYEGNEPLLFRAETDKWEILFHTGPSKRTYMVRFNQTSSIATVKVEDRLIGELNDLKEVQGSPEGWTQTDDSVIVKFRAEGECTVILKHVEY
ncbi:MAG: glycoside hydrolase family 31 protein [Candidatus Eremiobacteraeota bacterium]|nr:glycoside hydrolase family 31 protein [Candidatus Eremiobacteraeota bacterium]